MATTTLNIRGIEEEAAERIKQVSHGRGLTIARYAERLLALHDRLREREDDPSVREHLEAVGLAPVRV